ncbi:hypothetical protein SAMN05216548_113106 [Faunimonas pinastri]|uniref:Uncharacterized protein n=1 Tax=Faunimonas pinastri TaxID=1855383 RepID=A0A1H9MHY0_9HYPH|nr:hypothetical protein [Faunimonas pinastri]SER22743.1 hypothetical protein SAMN05216548_113106 [Faunimonas pinastri]
MKIVGLGLATALLAGLVAVQPAAAGTMPQSPALSQPSHVATDVQWDGGWHPHHGYYGPRYGYPPPPPPPRYGYGWHRPGPRCWVESHRTWRHGHPVIYSVRRCD